MRSLLRRALTVAVLAPSLLRAQTGALTLVGENGASRKLSAVEVAALPQVELRVRERDSSIAVFKGPALPSLLALVGAPEGHDLRGPNLLLVVIAEAADGYRVAYTLAELDEQLGGHQTILAITQDGQPLRPETGPYRIVMSGETTHRARWPRQIVKLRLLRVGN